MARHSGDSTAGTVLQFFFSTFPFLAVLVYLLYMAVERGNESEDDMGDDDLFSLMDITIVFLSFHVSWTMFAVYILIFVPKRRYLLERYLREGEKTLGDVIVEDPSRNAGPNCLTSRQYGYAIYSHPTKTDVVVRKKVRVYQPFTKERVMIIRLPNRPLSGQAKIDIEIDLSKMRTERESTLCYISIVSIIWVLFALAGACFCVYQMAIIPEELLMDDENIEVARRILFFIAGINPFLAFAVNGLRYIMYHNWMVHSGASIKDEEEARNMKPDTWCLYNNNDAASFDGSDQIPYSILGEDKSHVGTINSHSRSVVTKKEEAEGRESKLTVTSVEDDGANVKSVPWTNV